MCGFGENDGGWWEGLGDKFAARLQTYLQDYGVAYPWIVDIDNVNAPTYPARWSEVEEAL